MQQNRDRKLLIDRLDVVKLLLVVVALTFLGRLFYVQVLKADYYDSLAKGEQFRELEIEPERGTIYVQNGSLEPVAITLNESRYTIFADPTFIQDKNKTASDLADALGIEQSEVESKLEQDSLRYVVIAKKQTKEVRDKVAQKSLKGVAWREERQRTYPQGTLASQIIGFVNDEGEGQYGVEGYLNDELSGKPGVIRAVTDVQGVPLAQNDDNIVSAPEDGTDIVLTIDQTIQQIAEDEIKAGIERTGAKSGSAIVMEANTGRIKAMANYPSFNPAEYTKVEDASLFKNKVVTDSLEPGSIMKTLTVSSALDQGVIGKSGTYNDTGSQTIDGVTITNAINFGTGQTSVFEILQNSLNTGAVEMLKLMGGGEVNAQARTRFYGYLDQSFMFTQDTPVEQQGASTGIIPDPLEGDGLNIQYANMSFGQGLTVTLQQFASALSAAINGGTYYSPTVVYSRSSQEGIVVQEPKAIKKFVVSENTSNSIRELMQEYIVVTRSNPRTEFVMGGKTGTAQVPDGNGGYRTDIYNTTFAGFIGKDAPKYVIVVRLNEGNALSGEFTGFKSARPVFLGIANGIFDRVPLTD